MRSIDLELEDLLPEINGLEDECVERLIAAIKRERGVISVVLDERHKAKLVIAFDGSQNTSTAIQQAASIQSHRLLNKYGHFFGELEGIRNTRHARRIGQLLQKIPGIVSVSVGFGSIKMEWDKDIVALHEIKAQIDKLGVRLKPPVPSYPLIVQTRSLIRRIKSMHVNQVELLLAAVSGVCWLAGVLFSFFQWGATLVPMSLYIAGILTGGYFTLLEASRALSRGKFEIDFLMIVAALGAAILGQWSDGALLLFLFSLGNALEHYAMNRARKSIRALSDLTPDEALLISGDQVVAVPLEEIKVGDTIRVKPNTKIPLDGRVVSGKSAVNEAPITGESVPVEKFPSDSLENTSLDKLSKSHRAFAGTLNGTGTLEIRVLRLASDSTIARLIQMVKEAETQKSPTQHLADRFERYYVPGVLMLVTVLLFAFVLIDETFNESFYRAMAVLIAASPCALAISTPSAVLAGVARAAKQGVLIKGGRPLELLGKVRVLAFDKTGTLTEGRPRLTAVVPYNQTTETELLSVAVAVESLSDHPLAAAIAQEGQKRLGKKALAKARDLESLTARGVRARIENNTVHIGNRRLLLELTGHPIPESIEQAMSHLERKGHTATIVHMDKDYLGVIGVMDVARKEAAPVLSELRKMNIDRMIMLSGDHQSVANAIAADLHITDPMGNLLPEEKVSAIQQLKKSEGIVAMVGDGVNDAPAMAQSDLGIAMGAAGSDVALETADIALMGDNLKLLPFAIALSRKARRIIKQNIWISLGMVAFLVPLTITGMLSIGPAVVGHEGSTIVVVLNALRLLGFQYKTGT